MIDGVIGAVTIRRRRPTGPRSLHNKAGVTPQLEIVRFEYNVRDPAAMSILITNYEAINAKELKSYVAATPCSSKWIHRQIRNRQNKQAERRPKPEIFTVFPAGSPVGPLVVYPWCTPTPRFYFLAVPLTPMSACSRVNRRKM